ncbi:flavin reductase family protein [Williamsia sp. D3]|uniref:flavin reductase family protein n=1 Tax=Williamsia sp. D3 TaxID=1313067 RepID=UPI0003D2A739|nr:flavin reductase family protein [Williamsia sp. D3]ETD33296.1 flavin reductase [Williamsia sp. D3]
MVNTGNPDDSAHALDRRHFRDVLGQYPTGVTLITARSSDGDPVGMVVGTFTSVSLDPPLVGFLPDRTSTTWPKIEASGSFTANVLTSSQEDVVRAFTQKHDDRFTRFEWVPTASGGLRLKGAAAWIDCTIEDVRSAGDHYLVLGNVKDLGDGDSASLPLLFLRGGYGSFSMPSIQSSDSTLLKHLEAVDAARPEIEVLAADLKVECLVTVAAEDLVVVASAAGVEWSPRKFRTPVGVAFPLAAPLSPTHVAWSGEDAQRRWIAEGRRHLGLLDDSLVSNDLATVRDQGYDVRSSRAAQAEWELSVNSASGAGTVDLVDSMRQLMLGIEAGTNRVIADGKVVSISAPVFGPDGEVAICLYLKFADEEPAARVQLCLERLLAATARLTTRIGGTVSGTGPID